jgi:hypothetical protein
MNSPMKKMPRTKGKYRPRAYSIEFTSPPSMQPRTLKGESSLIQRLSRARVLLLGFNQYDTPAQSVKFTQSLLERIVTEAQKRGDKDAVVTLALDESIPAATRESFENMDAVKKRGVRVVSVGVGAETVARVEKKGFEGLTDDDRAKYMPDPTDFVQSVANKGFKRYADASIVDDYNRDAQRLGKKAADMPSSEKYFAKEILQNEGIAAQLAKNVAGRPNDLTVLVTDDSRVRFGYGVKERTLKLLQVLEAGGGGEGAPAPPSGGGSAAAITATGNPDRVLSVMIDPTAADSLSATAQLRLSLAYGQYLGDQRPLADFVWFSEAPPLKIIARPKNPINKEGDKPAGESSVIGAFNARS